MIEPKADMKAIPDTKRATPHGSPQNGTGWVWSRSKAGAPLISRRTRIIALISAFGLITWFILTFITNVSAPQPGASLISGILAQWRASNVNGTGLSQTNGNVSGNLPRLATPLQCDSTGTSSIGTDLSIPPTEVICGDVLVIGANVTVQGEVRGSIRVIGGNAIISGVISSDITVIGGNISVQTGGRVYGAAHAIGGTVVAAPNTIVNNTGSDIQQPHDWTQAPGFNVSIDIGAFWLSLLFWISAALGLTALAPEMIGHVRYTVRQRLALSGIIGAILALAAGVVSVALVFTCLGIPLALAIAAAVWFAWVVGTVGLGAWLGSALFGGSRSSHPPSLILSAVFGVLILTVLKALPVAGPFIGYLTGSIALGAAMLTLLSARRISYARPR